MKGNSLRKMIALLLCCVMVFSAIGCSSKKDDEVKQEQGKTDAEEKDNEEKDDEVITLTLHSSFSQGATFEETPWFEEILEEELGIRFEVLATTADVPLATTMIAGGEVTDIFAGVFGQSDSNDIGLALEQGLLLNLEEYKDQLPNFFENEVFDTTKLYMSEKFPYMGALPLNVGTSDSLMYGTCIRFDLYQELGCPEIGDRWALLDMLEDMWELEKETKEGLPTYPLGYMGAWGSALAITAGYSVVNNGYSDIAGKIFEVNTDGTGDIRFCGDEDSVFYDGIKWYFEANQRGLLDPDSSTMTWDNYSTKANNGQYMFVNYNWWGGHDVETEDWWGYRPVAVEGSAAVVLEKDYAIGSGRYIGLSSQLEGKKLEKALEFLNWYYDMDVQQWWFSGNPGEYYDFDEDGNPAGTGVSKSDEIYYDGTFGTQISVINSQPYTNYTVCPNGLPIDVTNAPNYVKSEMNPWGKAYFEYLGGYYALSDSLRAAGDDEDILKISFATSFFSNPEDEEIQLAISSVATLLDEAVTKMIFAADEAEFNAVHEQLMRDAEEAGLEEIMKDAQERWSAAQEEAASLEVN